MIFKVPSNSAISSLKIQANHTYTMGKNIKLYKLGTNTALFILSYIDHSNFGYLHPLFELLGECVAVY